MQHYIFAQQTKNEVKSYVHGLDSLPNGGVSYKSKPFRSGNSFKWPDVHIINDK